jgi:ankyrin repeat protein
LYSPEYRYIQDETRKEATNAQVLLEEGADINAANIDDHTALHIASNAGYTRVVQALLETGADVDALANDWTALYYASVNGSTEIAQLLLANGADLNHLDKHRHTPFHEAISMGHEECVAFLLEKGADFNSQGFEGRSALHWAVFQAEEIVPIILEKEPDVNRQDWRGNTPLHDATYHGSQTSVRLLLEKK